MTNILSNKTECWYLQWKPSPFGTSPHSGL